MEGDRSEIDIFKELKWNLTIASIKLLDRLTVIVMETGMRIGQRGETGMLQIFLFSLYHLISNSSSALSVSVEQLYKI